MDATQDRIAQYEAKVAEKPDNELLRFSLGKALFDANRYEEAEKHFTVAFQKKNDWMVVAILLAKCALQRGDKKTAREFAQKAMDLAVAQHHEGPQVEIKEMLEGLD